MSDDCTCEKAVGKGAYRVERWINPDCSIHGRRGRGDPREDITIRIYGMNLTLWRTQWEAMVEDMQPNCDNARRINQYLEAAT